MRSTGRKGLTKCASATAIPARFLSILDFDHETLDACLELRRASTRRRGRPASHDQTVSTHRHVALLFEKPSLRTRSTFQIAVRELGGDVIEPGDRRRARRTRVDWRMSPGISSGGSSRAVVRTYAQDRLNEFAARGAASSRPQRADQRGASVPGACRLPHAAGGLGQPARPDDRVRRRRQQRRDLARAGGGHAGCARSRRVARPVSSCPIASSMTSLASRAAAVARGA